MSITSKARFSVWTVTVVSLIVFTLIAESPVYSNDQSEPASPDRAGFSAVGWRSAASADGMQTDAGSEFGLGWTSESVWVFTGADDPAAVVRLNNGSIIPGDIIMEYIVRTCAPDGTPAGQVYGQVSYSGFSDSGLWLVESLCSIPLPGSCRKTALEPSQVPWQDLRMALRTSGASRTLSYVFPIDAEEIAFGPTGRLGFSIVFKGLPELDIAVEAALPVTETSRAESEPDVQAAGEAEPAADSLLSDFTAPERTAKFFLEAVMIDKDPAKAARAWSPRVPRSAVEAVVKSEIELFAERSSDVLRLVLSSIGYSTQHISETEAVVSIVDNGEEAVLGRLELHGGEWLFVALGYQLDSDLNLTPEWKRVIERGQ